MKVTKLRTVVVKLPLDAVSGIGSPHIKSAGCVCVYLESDQGVIGEGLVFSLNANRIGVLNQLVLSLEDLVVGLNLSQSGMFALRAFSEMKSLGTLGLVASAISGVESALFDLRAKVHQQNVAAMLGACRTSIPAYHSGGLWVERSIDELQSAAASHLKQGFRAMKIRLHGDPKIDVPRLRAVRDVIGPDNRLLADANQRMTVPQALRLGRELEEFQLAWLEEPIAAENHEGEAEIAAALDTPIAAGESVYTSAGIYEILKARAADIVMPDLQRMGGPSEFIKAANIAAAFNVPMSNHLYSEMSLSLLACIPNAMILEFMNWFTQVYVETIEMDDKGHAIVPMHRPGWGYNFDEKAVKRFAA